MKTIIYLTKVAWKDRDNYPILRKIKVIFPLFIFPVIGIIYTHRHSLSFGLNTAITFTMISLFILIELLNLRDFINKYKLDMNPSREDYLNTYLKMDSLFIKLNFYWIKVTSLIMLLSLLFFIILFTLEYLL